MGWTFWPFNPVAGWIWLLGSHPRSNGVVPGGPHVGFFVVAGVYCPGILSPCFFLQKPDVSPPLRVRIIFSFILVYARYPSSTFRVDLPWTDICPISLIPK